MTALDQNAIRLLFSDARSQNGWKPDPVSDEMLQAAHDIAKWGPTSLNSQPLRIAFLRSQAAKERLRPALSPGNVDKAMSAPVVAIMAYDLTFPEHLPRMFPHNPAVQNMFTGKDAFIEATAFRNATLQGAYFLLGARAVGLDVGPMSGFDNAKVDAEFFAGTSIKSNFLCGIGKGDPSKVFGRSPRFDLTEISTKL